MCLISKLHLCGFILWQPQLKTSYPITGAFCHSISGSQHLILMLRGPIIKSSQTKIRKELNRHRQWCDDASLFLMSSARMRLMKRAISSNIQVRNAKRLSQSCLKQPSGERSKATRSTFTLARHMHGKASYPGVNPSIQHKPNLRNRPQTAFPFH